MNIFLYFYLIINFGQLTVAMNHNIICYYDAVSEERKDLGHFSFGHLESALEFCTHVIYGYAGINSLSLQITSLKPERDIHRSLFTEFTSLKTKYPDTKFLLSLGGGKDLDLGLSNKYIKLLEADAETQKSFIDSVVYFLRNYKFDGLDLAYQFPPLDNQELTDVPWNYLRKLIKQKINKRAGLENDYKNQFSILIENLRKAFMPHDLMLGLTVLPNVNASFYINASAIINYLDFFNLQTFDFTTPELSPTEATYTAPLYSLPVQGSSNVRHSIDYQVNYWISQSIPRNKIHVGIAAYGRAWKMTSASQADGFPKVLATNGPTAASYIAKLPGILTWTEICVMLSNNLNANKTGALAPLLSVLDPYKDFVTYAFRPADVNGEHGMWISYDDPRIAAIKAAYVRQRNLGGIAIYDISLDDFHGICNGDTFPMLRYIKYTFL